MKILALDTSTRALSLAVAEGERVEKDASGAECSSESGSASQPRGADAAVTQISSAHLLASVTQVLPGQHGETLAPQVQEILASQGWTTADLDAVVVGVGPGSYTGLRIGVTFAKTLAYALKIPVYQVSSLALMAARVGVGAGDSVIPIMDARRGTAYTGLYQQGQAVIADLHTDFAEWIAGLDLPQEAESGSLTLIGTDIEEFVKIAAEFYPQLQVVTGDAAYPDVAQAFGGTPVQAVDDVNLLVPNYAHETLAEQEWRQGQGEEVGKGAGKPAGSADSDSAGSQTDDPNQDPFIELY